jgi:prophage maintenance system killer protein
MTTAFLRMNGYRLTFNDLEAYGFLINLYETGKMRFSELDAWLRMHATPLIAR